MRLCGVGWVRFVLETVSHSLSLPGAGLIQPAYAWLGFAFVFKVRAMAGLGLMSQVCATTPSWIFLVYQGFVSLLTPCLPTRFTHLYVLLAVLLA